MDFQNHESLQTMFLVSGRNQLQLIAIADNKANMITAVCTILVFLILLIFGAELILHDSTIFDNLQFVLPLGILLAFCSISAICAILALKPKIIRAKKKGRSALFFSNYYRKSLEEYKEGMYKVMASDKTIYDQMLTDKYYNGLVLERKYSLLGFSYTLFLIAIVLSVSSYVITSVM